MWRLRNKSFLWFGVCMQKGGKTQHHLSCSVFPLRSAVTDYATNAVRNDVGFGAPSAEGAFRGAVITIFLWSCSVSTHHSSSWLDNQQHNAQSHHPPLPPIMGLKNAASVAPAVSVELVCGAATMDSTSAGEPQLSWFMAKSEAAPSKQICDQFACSPSKRFCDLDFPSVSAASASETSYCTVY